MLTVLPVPVSPHTSTCLPVHEQRVEDTCTASCPPVGTMISKRKPAELSCWYGSAHVFIHFDPRP